MSEFAAEALGILLANGIVATVLALGAWLAQRFDRPRLVHALCVLALLKLVTPPLWAVPIVTFAAAPAPGLLPAPFAIETLTALPEAAPAASPVDPATLALVLTLLGTVGLMTLAWLRARRFRRLIRVAAAPPAHLRARARALAARVGLDRCPDLLVLPARISPMLCLLGGRTLLLLPRDLLTRINEAELDALLTHELAHAQRRDHWVRLLELIAFALYWWLPTAWWLRRALHAAEERCCDARVLALHPERPRAYADALLHTLDFLAGSRRAMPPAACGASAYTDLSRRLTSIMTMTHERPLSRLTRTCLAALAVGVLPIAPSFAQESERVDDSKVRAELRSAAREVAKLRAEIEAIRAELGAAREGKADAKKADARKAKGHVLELTDITDEHAHVDALRKAMNIHTIDPERLHAVIAEKIKLDHDALLKATTENVDVQRILEKAHAKLLDAEGLDRVTSAEAHKAVAEAMKKVHEAQAKAARTLEKAAFERAKAQHEAHAGHQADADAADAHREAVIHKLRAVETGQGGGGRIATRVRDDGDHREAQMRAIEAEMKKLQKKLEELRRQGDGEHGERRATRSGR